MILCDGCLVWVGPVVHDCLHLAAPPGSLIAEEPRQRRFRATWDHRQHLATVTAGDDGHIPVPATLRHPLRVGSHPAHDPMPPHPVMAGHRPNRHHRCVGHQTASEPAGQPGLELGMILEVPLAAVSTFEPASTPHQDHPAAAHLQVTNPLRSSVPHPIAAEPTMAAPRPFPGRSDFNLKTLNRVDQHSGHANTRQVQPNGHNIRHRGLTPIPRISTHPPHNSAQPHQTTAACIGGFRLRGCADSSLPGGTVAARVDESTAMTRAFPSGKRVEFTRGGGRF